MDARITIVRGWYCPECGSFVPDDGEDSGISECPDCGAHVALVGGPVAPPDLLDALGGLFKHWGNGSNAKEADAAIERARAAYDKYRGHDHANHRQ